MNQFSIKELILFCMVCSLSVIAGEKPMQAGDDRLSQKEVVDKDGLTKDANTFRILFVGDSITRHGFNDDTIKRLGWGHESGMAASVLEKDYAHRLAEKIQQTLAPGNHVECRYPLTSCKGSISGALETIDESQKLKPDLVVIQLGEHEKQKDGGGEAIQKNLILLLQTIKGWSGSPRIIVAGVWDPYRKGEISAYAGWAKEIEDKMRAACMQEKVPFASVSKYALDPSCSGSGTSGGVRWHPNDKGMEGYAEELYSCYQQTALKTK